MNVHAAAQEALDAKFPNRGFVLGKPYMNSDHEIVFPYGSPAAMGGSGDWSQMETDAPALVIKVAESGAAKAEWLAFSAKSKEYMRRISPARNSALSRS